jgi:hypothetical protein
MWTCACTLPWPYSPSEKIFCDILITILIRGPTDQYNATYFQKIASIHNIADFCDIVHDFFVPSLSLQHAMFDFPVALLGILHFSYLDAIIDSIEYI